MSCARDDNGASANEAKEVRRTGTEAKLTRPSARAAYLRSPPAPPLVWTAKPFE